MGLVATGDSFFSDIGRRRLTKRYRVFSEDELSYYNIKSREWDFDTIASRYNSSGHLGFKLDSGKFGAACASLEKKFGAVADVANLFKGVKVPFVIPKIEAQRDLSDSLIVDFLPALEASFRAAYPLAHFKAVMQGGATLKNNLVIAEGSRYNQLLDLASQGPLVGWYFPQALQQFDVASQIEQMSELPALEGMCLSGPVEIIHAVLGLPGLLINEEGYAPILCMSAVRHIDERLALVLKAYGPHLEFWCLSQMLSVGVTQASEQWAGGITLFQHYDNR